MPKLLTVKDLPSPERPRERLEQLGPQALSASELLAIILGRGTAGQPVIMLSQELLSRYGSLEELAECSVQDLLVLKGLGLAKAAQLLACFELARRIQPVHGSVVTRSWALVSPAQSAVAVRSRIRNFNKEHCFVLSFTVRNKLIAVDGLSVGILNANLVHPRETFSLAIRRHAAGLVLVHNHPSGDLEPSADDLDITTRLVTAGKILGVEFLDHIIISRSGYLSFRERNLF